MGVAVCRYFFNTMVRLSVVVFTGSLIDAEGGG